MGGVARAVLAEDVFTWELAGRSRREWDVTLTRSAPARPEMVFRLKPVTPFLVEAAAGARGLADNGARAIAGKDGLLRFTELGGHGDGPVAVRAVWRAAGGVGARLLYYLVNSASIPLKACGVPSGPSVMSGRKQTIA